MYLIEDSFKKEAKPFVFAGIAFSFYAMISIIVLVVDDREISREIATRLSMISLPACILAWYTYFWYSKYTLTIAHDQAIVKTLFGEHIVYLRDVVSYSCKKIRKQEWYQFELFIQNKRIKVRTHYKDKLIGILENQQT